MTRLVEQIERPSDRVQFAQTISKGELDYKGLKVGPTIMTQRETRCRALVRNRYGNKNLYHRCTFLAYLDAYIDPEELFGSDGRVALCWTHAYVCERGNLRIAR